MKLPFSVDLNGKVAVITGAGGVLCSVFAEAIAECGARVALLDINEAAIAEVADKIRKNGGEAIAVKTNCLERASLEAAYGAVKEAYGAPDILINGAGGNNPRATTADEYFDPTSLDMDGKTNEDRIIGVNFVDYGLMDATGMITLEGTGEGEAVAKPVQPETGVQPEAEELLNPSTLHTRKTKYCMRRGHRLL